MLTARDAVEDRVRGLDAGADDYVVKPFAIDEVVARLHALTRRGRDRSDRLSFAGLTLDTDDQHGRTSAEGSAIELSARESQLLELLLRDPRSVVSRDAAIERIWGGAAVSNIVDRYVAQAAAQARRSADDPDRAGGRLHTRRVRARSLNFRLTAASIAAVAAGGARLRRRRADRSSAARCTPRWTAACASGRSKSRASASPRRRCSPRPVRSNRRCPGRQLSVEVLDRKRAIVARSLALGAKLLPRGPEVGAALRGRQRLRRQLSSTANRSGSSRRRSPTSAGRRPAGWCWSPPAPPTSRTPCTSSACCSCSAARSRSLVGGLAAALLTRRSVRPLRELSSSATEIERTGDASRRLAEPADPEEIGELARTLNAMLGALESSRERERRFLADASHELRTPLTSLIGNVDFLARHGAGAGGGRRPAGGCRAPAPAGRRPARARARERCGRARAAGAARAHRRRGQRREAQRRQPRSTGRRRCIGEPDALARSLENLLENAAVHGPRRRPGRDFDAGRRAGEAEVAVTDEGRGFRRAAEEAAFERFWRAEEARGRAGLGNRPGDRQGDRRAPRRQGPGGAVHRHGHASGGSARPDLKRRPATMSAAASRSGRRSR